MAPDDLEQIDLLVSDWENNSRKGAEDNIESICKSHPHLAEKVRQKVSALKQMGWLSPQMESQIETTREPKNFRFAVGDEPFAGIQLETLIGMGGSGEVWKARSALHGTVALKIVSLEKRSVQAEIKTLGWLRQAQHPHLLNIIAMESSEEFLFITMELAQRTLYDSFLREREKGKPGLETEVVLPWLKEAALALDFMHQPIHGPQHQSIQHRDIKPQNMLLLDGHLKVGDFGLARLHAHSMTSHTGALTLGYAAPEFFDGKTHLHSDQYSLACTLVQMVSGHLPFEGTSAQVMHGHLHGIPNLHGVPLKLHQPLLRALSRKPALRWPSCIEFIAALEKGKAPGESILSRRAMLGALGLAGTGSLAYFGFKQWQDSPIPNDREPWPLKVTKPTFLHTLSPEHHLGPVREIDTTRILYEDSSQRVLGFSNGANGPALWNLKSGKLIQGFDKEYGGACAAVAPLEMPLVASGSDTNIVTVWNLLTLSSVSQLKGHGSAVNSVNFSRDGLRLVSSACDGKVKVWDYRKELEIASFDCSNRIAYTCGFGPTGEWVTAGGWDGKIALWDIASKTKTEVGSHSGKVWRILVPMDGRTLISCGSDGFLKIWDLKDKKEQHTVDLQHELTGLALIEGRMLATAGNSKVHVFRIPDMKKLYTVDTPPEIECIHLTRIYSHFICLTVGTKANGLHVYALPFATEDPGAA